MRTAVVIVIVDVLSGTLALVRVVSYIQKRRIRHSPLISSKEKDKKEKVTHCCGCCCRQPPRRSLACYRYKLIQGGDNWNYGMTKNNFHDLQEWLLSSSSTSSAAFCLLLPL